MTRAKVLLLLFAAATAAANPASAQRVSDWLHTGTDSAELSGIGSCWRTQPNSSGATSDVKCGDALPSNYLARALARQITVAPGAAFSVRFDPPAASMTVFERETRRTVTELRAPDSAGVYQYSVAAKWENGQGNWMFQIKVETSRQGMPNDTNAVIATMWRLFTAMERHDSALARAVLIPGMSFVSQSIGTVPQPVRVQSDTAFIRQLGASKQMWIERMWSPTVSIQGDIATIWAPYDFYVDGVKSHCGIDTGTLMRTTDGWRIATLAYTVQRTGCPFNPLGPPG